MKKKLFPILATFALSLVFGFAACAEDGKSAYDLAVENGYSGTVEEWLESLKGEDGKDGTNGTDGENGDNGVNGEDGLTPSIGDNGNWWIGETDTGISAAGKDGADGENGVIWTETCDAAEGGEHTLVKHTIRYATCRDTEVVFEYCTACELFHTIEGELNAEVHGTYEWKDVDGIMTLALKQNLEQLPETEMEEANNACHKMLCKDCNTMLQQHPSTAWYPVDERANVCEEEHLVVEACTVCHATVSEVKVEGALGHKYGDPVVIVKVGENYKIKLTCTTCDKEIEVLAKPIETKAPNCKEGGYTVYEYTFNNYLEDITKTFTYDIVNKTTAHTFTDGTNTLMFDQGEEVHFTPENTDALKALIEKDIIRWTEGEPEQCDGIKVAGGDCAVCGELFTIDLSGEHVYGDPVPSTCLVNGYFECTLCSHKVDNVEDYAPGHSWKYKSLDKTAKTMTIVCSCGAEATIAYTEEYVSAENCLEKSKTIYTVTTTNGLATTAPKYNGKVVVKHEVLDEEQRAHNVLGFNLKQGANYEYNTLASIIGVEGGIRWTEGEPGVCNAYKIAGFDCETCGNLVTINLSGEHTLDGVDNVTAPGCTTRGYTTQKCTVCTKDVEVAATDATGHTFVADTTSWDAFVAAPADGKVVKFVCACGVSIDLAAVLTTSSSASGCVTVDKSTYTFTYNYTVESKAEEDLPKTFTKSHVVDNSTGTHTCGNIKGLVQGGEYEYNPNFAAAFADGILRWAEGEPSACNDKWIAGFDCSVCGHLVTIKVSGPHNIENAVEQTKAPTCTTAGYTYKVCADCGTEVKLEDIPATDHKVVWTVVGADEYNPGKAVGTCSVCGDSVEVDGKIVEKVDETCGTDGYVTYKYVYNGEEVVERVTFILVRTGNHSATQYPQVEFEYDGHKYVAYFCNVCECFVVIEKDGVAIS